MNLPTNCGVYAIELGEGRWKIGVTRNLRERVETQNDHGGLVIIAPYDNMRAALVLEKRMHAALVEVIVGTWHGPAHGYDVFEVSLFDLRMCFLEHTKNLEIYIPGGSHERLLH